MGKSVTQASLLGSLLKMELEVVVCNVVFLSLLGEI